jgi:hypothetical protein
MRYNSRVKLTAVRRLALASMIGGLAVSSDPFPQANAAEIPTGQSSSM